MEALLSTLLLVNMLPGLMSTGCPFSSSLTSESHVRAKRMVNFKKLNCLSGWAPCTANSKYRTIDGRCNNLRHPTWGSALLPNIRYMEPDYADGFGSPRQHSVSGACLPTARRVSNGIHMVKSDSKMKMSPSNTHMLMLWGQFLDHDLTLTPIKDTRACCSYEGRWRDSTTTGRCEPKSSSSQLRSRLMKVHKSRSDKYSEDFCMGIELERGDKTFGVNHQCIDFQRSVAVPTTSDCHTGRREQLNSVTAFIDGSQIYGSDDLLSWELRERKHGLLKTSDHHFLPPEDKLTNSVYSECVRVSRTDECFKAGDERVNVQPGLASIHTLFVMEHNRIARILRANIRQSRFRSSPTMTEDEFIYQETRRIVGAMLQHITFNEFLPVLLGTMNMYRYGLVLNKDSPRKTEYGANIQPSIRSEFSTFAFRVGHTLVPEGLLAMNSRFEPHGSMTHFFGQFQNPHMLYKHGVSDLLRGIIDKPAKLSGPHLNHDLERVFPFSNRTVGGMDLAAVNIQRGRDHGIPSYTKLRKHCRLSVPKSFSDLDMSLESKRALARVYESVEDIDAWTGAVSETPQRGAVIGPLNACIIGRQMRALRRGDRFWYEFQQPTVGLTDRQLKEIYKSSLARVMCDNLDMQTVQPKVFYLPKHKGNGRVSCSSIPSIQLHNWFRL